MDRSVRRGVRRGMGRTFVLPLLVLVVVLVVVLAPLSSGSWLVGPGGSVGSRLELVAVLAFLGASAVAFGALDRPRRQRVSDPDERTANLAGGVLAGLDGVEHRRMELGDPWPQLSVGPTGVALIDVCDLDGPVVLDGSVVRRLGERRACSGCAAMLETEGRVRDALAAVDPAMRVRSIAVVAPGTAISSTSSAADLTVVGVDGLADLLARGRVLPMPAVDAAFAALSRASVVDDPA